VKPEIIIILFGALIVVVNTLVQILIKKDSENKALKERNEQNQNMMQLMMVKGMLSAPGSADKTPGEIIKVLTKRELEIGYLLYKGKTYKEIASDLEISPNTVDNHISKIYKKNWYTWEYRFYIFFDR
jgi:DNA-binding NarL/FixJ family response regulator